MRSPVIATSWPSIRIPRNVPNSCVRVLKGPGFVSSASAIMSGTSLDPSVMISTPGSALSAGVPTICSPVSASRVLNASGAETAFGVKRTAISDPDMIAPSAAKLCGEISTMSAKGAIANGKRRARAPPSAKACWLVVSAFQIGRSSGWVMVTPTGPLKARIRNAPTTPAAHICRAPSHGAPAPRPVRASRPCAGRSPQLTLPD